IPAEAATPMSQNQRFLPTLGILIFRGAIRVGGFGHFWEVDPSGIPGMGVAVVRATREWGKTTLKLKLSANSAANRAAPGREVISVDGRDSRIAQYNRRLVRKVKAQ